MVRVVDHAEQGALFTDASDQVANGPAHRGVLVWRLVVLTGDRSPWSRGAGQSPQKRKRVRVASGGAGEAEQLPAQIGEEGERALAIARRRPDDDDGS